jgi:hypothetical protein
VQAALGLFWVTSAACPAGEPTERALQDEHGGVLIDHLGAARRLLENALRTD